jgi:hypothetical protein
MIIELIKKNWTTYSIEIIIAIILINWDLRIFLVYAYLALILKSDVNANYLRKLIRVLHIGNEVKLMSLQKKLGISPEETAHIFKEEYENKLTAQQYAQLEKDITDLVSK